MAALLERLFSCRYMLPQNEIQGEIPSSGTIYRKALKLAWPTALEFTLIALIGFVDTLMVSELSLSAVAAVGITNAPKMVLMAFIYSLCAGITPIVARRTGEGNTQGATNCLKQALLLCFLLASLLTAAGIVFARPIMVVSGAEDSYLADAVIYFQIVSVGFFFNALGAAINAAMRAVGRPKVSMYANVGANVINVVLNYLLISGHFGFPALGVRGAAIATTIGNFIAFCISLFSVLRRESPLRLTRGHWRLEKETMQPMLKLGSAGLIHQLCMKVGFWFFTTMVASLGESPFATHQICMNVLNLSFCVSDGFDVTTGALVGQALGAKRIDLAKIYVKTDQRIVFLNSLLLMAGMFFLRRPLMGLFTDDAAVITLGAQMMILMAITTPIQNAQVVFAGCMRGAGDTGFVAYTSFMGYVVLRPIAAWLLCFPLKLGLAGAWITTFLDQLLRLLLFYGRFKSEKWTEIKV